ncbi:unnamed protein product [Linum tenue]|nr:unnamed protein product [Linum tenue]
MRKKAQERKRAAATMSSPSSSSSSNHSSSSNTTKGGEEQPSFYDTGGNHVAAAVATTGKTNDLMQVGDKGYSMDDIWKDIEGTIFEPVVSEGLTQEGCNFSGPPSLVSPDWDYCTNDTLWKLDDEEESKMFLPYDYGTAFLTG